MKDGYGFFVPNDDECVFYGHDDVFNGHAMIQKLDESLDKALWETKLDWQLPGSDTAVLEYALKTSDGGYVAWLREGCPGEDEWSSYHSCCVFGVQQNTCHLHNGKKKGCR